MRHGVPAGPLGACVGMGVAEPGVLQLDAAIMPTPTTRSAADPLDDIDRETSGVDSAMSRQDRADIPGHRSDHPDAGQPSDKYSDATREIVEGSPDIDESVLEDHEGSRVLPEDDKRDLAVPRDGLSPPESRSGADDDDPIDETERAGDDSR
jgi:hypothetical protein